MIVFVSCLLAGREGGKEGYALFRVGRGGGEGRVGGVGRGRATITCTTVELLELKNHGAAAHSSWPARYGFV